MSLPDNKLLAAVDIGSNSVHLIIARVVHGALQPIQKYKERVQLAAGLSPELQLDDAAMTRGLQCLERMGGILADHQPDSVRVVATYTLRAALNRDEFLNPAEEALGFPIDVISGREESRLIFQGVAHAETLEQPTFVIDIGGGSTELAIGQGFDPAFYESCRMGCVGFSSTYFSKHIDKKRFSQAQTAALQALEKYLPKLNKLDWVNTYATSGSAKAIRQYCEYQGLNGDVIPIKLLRELRDELITQGSTDWLLDKGVSQDRVSLLPGGLAILLAVLDTFNIKSFSYRDVALREGVLYEMDEQMRHPDIRIRTRQSLAARYQIDSDFGAQVADTCEWLFSQVANEWQGIGGKAIDLLLEAANLHEIGLQISATALQKHSAYILSNSDLPGYNQDEQQLLGLLVSQHRKRYRPDEFGASRLIDDLCCLQLLRILRLAIILNIARRPINHGKLTLAVDEQSMTLVVEESYLHANPLLDADLQRESRYLSRIDQELHIKSA